MKIREFLKGFLLVALVSGLTSCVTMPAKDMSIATQILTSKGFVVTENSLLPYIDYVIADPLEQRVYFTGADFDEFVVGKSYALVFFSYEPGDDYITAEFRSMERDWIFSKYVSVYVGTEKLIDMSSGYSRRTDTSIVSAGYSSSVFTHEIYSMRLDIVDARKIAYSNKAKLTIRFGGGDAGYVDKKPHPSASMVGLRYIVGVFDMFSDAQMTQQRSASRPSYSEADLKEVGGDLIEEELPSNEIEADQATIVPIQSKTVSDFEKKLGAGEISLDKVGLFKGYGKALSAAKLRPKIEIFYAEGMWLRLAETVVEAGFGDDLSHYLLGKSAYELGYTNAALVYLERAIAESKRPLTGKCVSCMDIKLPGRAEALKSKILAERN